MRAVVEKWGDGIAVRLPAAVTRAARIVVDQPVDVRAEDGRILIVPLQAEPYDLAALVDGITDENRHESIDTGPAAGREVW